jgi:hypothetical protein
MIINRGDRDQVLVFGYSLDADKQFNSAVYDGAFRDRCRGGRPAVA